MKNFSIGVMLSNFLTDAPHAIKKAKKVGAEGVQIGAPLLFPKINQKERKELLDMVKAEGLIISALCGGGEFIRRNPEVSDPVEYTKRWIDLALDLETKIVTSHIGMIPSDVNHAHYHFLQEVCGEVGEYAERAGVCFGIETGPETAVVLKGFLDSLKSKGLGVNLDPANLVMVAADDPVQAVYTLKDYIVHTHAKDGVQLFYRDPEIIYGLKESDMLTSRSFKEVPLGEGKVDFKNYLRALNEIGYHGFLTIEREVGDKPEEDIIMAVQFLKNMIKDIPC